MKGEGKLFSFDLLDAGGGEIRVTAFNDQAEKFYAIVEVGGIYMVSKAGLQHKKPVRRTLQLCAWVAVQGLFPVMAAGDWACRVAQMLVVRYAAAIQQHQPRLRGAAGEGLCGGALP